MPKKILAPRKTLARIMVRPPARPSDSAVAVKQMFNGRAMLVRRDAVPKQYNTVINWGNPRAFTVPTGVRVFNKPEAIAIAINKLTCFQKMAEQYISIPTFVTEAPAATKMWLARTKLNASCGDGIVVVRPDDLAVPPASLYVEYIKKQNEYRLHVANGTVVFSQLKKKRAGFEQDKDEKLIRNYDNGWVFCIAPDGSVPQNAQQQAIAAVAAVGLDFGAVDIIIEKGTGTAYVLEINTAPGIESPTLKQAYADAFATMVM